MNWLSIDRWPRSLLVTLAVLILFLSGCRSSNGPGDGDDRSDDGRVPRCLDEDGIDLFAAEGDEVLGITWNNLGEADASGGYRVRYGTSPDGMAQEVISDCTDFECELNLSGLDNHVTYSLTIEALNIDGETTLVSCLVQATPHPLAFLPDVRVHADTSGTQNRPEIIVGQEGAPLFVAWEDEGAIRLSRSDDLGDTWSLPITMGSGIEQAQPALAFRNLVEEVTEAEDGTETTVVVKEPFLFLAKGLSQNRS